MLSPIRVFVGCDPNDCDLEQMMVLEYSIKKHCSQPVDIHWMQLSRDPESFWYSAPQQQLGWRTEEWATPFSGFRWAIPAFCNFTGKAIYMDADVMVMCDLAELWNTPFEPGKVVMAKGGGQSWRFCISMWDCAAAAAELPPIEEMRSQPGSHMKLVKHYKRNNTSIQPFDSQYNNIDGENSPIDQIKILHYSDMGTQFSHGRAIPRIEAEGRKHWFDDQILPHPRQDLQALFDRFYTEAIEAGYSLDQYRMRTPFGAFPKRSQQGYTGNEVTRPKRWWQHIGLLKSAVRSLR